MTKATNQDAIIYKKALTGYLSKACGIGFFDYLCKATHTMRRLSNWHKTPTPLHHLVQLN